MSVIFTAMINQSEPTFVFNLQSQGAVWTPDFFPEHTQNGELADREKIFTKVAKKCIGL